MTEYCAKCVPILWSVGFSEKDRWEAERDRTTENIVKDWSSCKVAWFKKAKLMKMY